MPSHSSEVLVAHNPDPPCLLLRDVSGVTTMRWMVTTSRPDELLPTLHAHANTARGTCSSKIVIFILTLKIHDNDHCENVSILTLLLVLSNLYHHDT